jgi:hypothetical protein
MGTAPTVAVVGSGFAGLETAFTVREHLGGNAELQLVVENPYFLSRPNNIYVPFGRDPELRVPLADPAARRNITLHQSPLADVDPAANRIDLADGSSIHYDYLVLATGAAMRPDEIPGLGEYAHTVWTPDKAQTLGAALAAVAESARARQKQRVLFLVPPGNLCSAPLYDMTLLLEQWLRSELVRDHVAIGLTTFEDRYLESFGPDLHGAIRSEFTALGIAGTTAARVESVQGRRGRNRPGSGCDDADPSTLTTMRPSEWFTSALVLPLYCVVFASKSSPASGAGSGPKVPAGALVVRSRSRCVASSSPPTRTSATQRSREPEERTLLRSNRGREPTVMDSSRRRRDGQRQAAWRPKWSMSESRLNWSPTSRWHI